MASIAASLVFLLGTLVPQSAVSTVPDTALSLGGVSLGDPEADVFVQLGQPISRRETGDFLTTELRYPGLTVWLGEDARVGEILSTSSQHCTPQGACPGRPFAQVKAMYGEPLVVDREDGRYMEYFPQSNFPCWLQIAVESGNVRSIRAECQP